MITFDVSLTFGIKKLSYIPLCIKKDMVGRIIGNGMKKIEITMLKNSEQFKDKYDMLRLVPPSDTVFYGYVVNTYGYEMLRKFNHIKGISTMINSHTILQSLEDGNTFENSLGNVGDIINDVNKFNDSNKDQLHHRIYIDKAFSDTKKQNANIFMPYIINQLKSKKIDDIVLYDITKSINLNIYDQNDTDEDSNVTSFTNRYYSKYRTITGSSIRIEPFDL